MSITPPPEGSRSHVVEALKVSPGTLALLVLSVAILAAIYYSNSSAREQQAEVMKMLIDKCSLAGKP